MSAHVCTWEVCVCVSVCVSSGRARENLQGRACGVVDVVDFQVPRLW